MALNTITLILFKEGALINFGLFHSAELPAPPKLERIYFNDVNDFDITMPPITVQMNTPVLGIYIII